MSTLLLTPTDTLYFKDGRPMSGALAGHTAAWPAPHVVNAALHAALHRAGVASHAHHSGNYRTRDYSNDSARDQKYGSLKTAGPFPVSPDGSWHFPTPADLAVEDEKSGAPKNAIVACEIAKVERGTSSLPEPLTHAPTSTLPPSKEGRPPEWLSGKSFKDYLEGKEIPLSENFLKEDQISDIEARIGIGIDAATGSQDGEQFYSAQTLRLRDKWHLGVVAEAEDKDAGDLMEKLLAAENHIVIGGQQRLCSVERMPEGASRPLCKLPHGLSAHADFFVEIDDGFAHEKYAKWRVKWVLLTPAIFPELKNHKGGWLPNWIDEKTGAVRLKAGDTERRPGEPRDVWRERVKNLPEIGALPAGNPGAPPAARLVAAIIGKPQVVTGWALGDATGGGTKTTGAKPAQFAVPAGSIYYFTCDTAEAAGQLAAALNWHGKDPGGAKILNRRSTLLGEKGYGLGVCGTW
ncbi:MAG: type III-B CRISPR module-associated protein Cmr3 [Puniceicoccales bacterium]|jgi:CRISPR type III-B/RAMP module-associated protein Cmr3|nr:type III-B CRISPR module-associated protein Cmr3 [Puniceicoccales bacterium]